MIKNYTSSVPVDRTFARIVQALVSAGATNIVTEYRAQRLAAICFSTTNPHTGERVVIRLPANVDKVAEALRARMKRPRKESLAKVEAQAERTAWKLVQDWTEIQMTLISMQQAEFMQVFMPYVWDGKQTLFDYMKRGGFKLLAAKEDK